ncbi:MAG: hypothetical protein KBG21_06615 [Ignavibacteria bacterium]|nr:hypothetical protein [Ignavibacteria bacterium]
MSRVIIILFAVYLIPLSANAQYYQSNVIDEVLFFVVKNEVSKSICIKDAQILASNKVREVMISNESKKPVGKLLINNFGYAEDFYTYNDTSGMIETHWRFGYDVNNNMTSASLRKGRQRINYILSYENNMLAGIHSDSAGVESRYDFAYVEGKIFKVTLLDLAKDTTGAKYFFNYDNAGELISVLNESRDEELFRVTYGNSYLRIDNISSKAISYQIKNDRIDYYSIVNSNASADIDKDDLTKEYIYSSKGLIEKIFVKSPVGKPLRTEEYEYNYYE